ncbi:MAG: peptidase [Nevskia sp.]|nr:peptidase [Nevskia sp.]
MPKGKIMKRVSALIAAALLLCGGLAEAKKGVRPDEIAELQKSGKIASFEKLNQAALAKHPDGHITKTALSAKDDRYDYKVRIAVPSGDSWNLKLDAGSATVLTDTKVLPPPLPSTYTPPTTPTPTPPAAPATH